METMKMDYTLGFDPERSRVDEDFVAVGGIVPNLMRVFATSTDALQAYLSFKDPSCHSQLDARLIKGIALAVADVNHCDCCGSVHDPRVPTAMPVEVDPDECIDSKDIKTRTAIEFARKIAIRKGNVSDRELDVLSLVGFSACDIVKIVANVALYGFSNCWNHVSKLTGRLPSEVQDSYKKDTTAALVSPRIQRLELSHRH